MCWKSITIENKSFFYQHFSAVSYPISDYNFTHLFIWSDMFNIRYIVHEGFLLIGGIDPMTMKPFIYMPIGYGELDGALNFVWSEYLGQEQALLVRGVSSSMTEELLIRLSQFDGCFDSERDEYEYIYNIDKFINYTGNVLRRKREICRAFERQHRYKFEPYHTEDKPLVLDLLSEWYVQYEGVIDMMLVGEQQAILKVLNVYDALNCVGFLLKVEDKVVGFLLAEKLTEDILVVHFEKGNRAYKGVYDLMKRELARVYEGQFKYISLEEDMGIEGLRKAKSMYRPDFFIEKGYIELTRTEGSVQHG